MLTFGADEPLQVLPAVLRGEVRGLPGDEGLRGGVAEVPCLGPQGRQGAGEHVADLIADQVPQRRRGDEHAPGGGFLPQRGASSLGIMESLPDEGLVSADETEVPLPAGPVERP